ncbi:MAG: hypothetical protein KAV87_30010, partial [Desulfobacteraceae bacterium]|nr:hypothetical protein [Desulfobacteraceae bacterium]
IRTIFGIITFNTNCLAWPDPIVPLYSHCHCPNSESLLGEMGFIWKQEINQIIVRQIQKTHTSQAV